MRLAIVLAAAVVCGALLAGSDAGTASAQTKGSGDLVEKAMPEKAPVTPKAARKILIYSRTAGFRHGSIGIGTRAITMMGEKTKAYLCVATEDESFFEPERLKTFDAVFMLNTTGECLRPKVDKKADPAILAEALKREEVLKQSLKDFVTSGKGLIGVHAATDTYHKWKDYNQMMGGTFISHPWSAKSNVSIKNVEPNHPVNAAFEAKGFDITDEIYVFTPDTALPTDRRYLLTLDETKMDLGKGKRKDGLYPISWISNYGKGRVFYCSLGHNDHIFWNPAVLKHYLAGIQFALGDLDADATPTGKGK